MQLAKGGRALLHKLLERQTQSKNCLDAICNIDSFFLSLLGLLMQRPYILMMVKHDEILLGKRSLPIA